MVSVQIAALVAALTAGGETALLDFHAPWCAPCRAMEGTIAALEQDGYPVRRINVADDRHLARQFNVQNIPCFVLVVDGREVARLTGTVGRSELENMMARGGVKRTPSAGAIARAQSPDPPRGRGALPIRPLVTAPVRPRFEQAQASAPLVQTAGSGGDAQDLIAASVRLTISDPQGNSYGSGTLIDAREGEALVLTCGHIFRDSQGKGQIAVDLCAPGGPQKLPGRLVSYDLDCDVALVSIRPGVAVRVAPLAPKGHRIARGDRVVTVGCNNGKEATAEQSTITAVNKFRAPPNLSVAGLPVQGRSGGGLFTVGGLVIGVCNAADPADNEGLYAALAAIQQELDEAGLTAIYEEGAQGTIGEVADVRPGPGPAAETTTAAEQAMPATVSTLADVQDRAGAAEVICIVRPLSNPDAKTEVIRLDRASSAFLQQLATDRQDQEARHLTSLRAKAVPPPSRARQDVFR